MSNGCVYLVGAGPGDPGLITVRGRQLLSRADAIVYDYLASPRLLECARPDAEQIYVGKQAGKHTLGQEEINQLLVDRARGGGRIVRLKGGDPFVFGRGGEEALALAEAGIAFEVVPGVTAGVAAAACAGIPVTHRKLASTLGLITGHEAPDKADSAIDYSNLAGWSGTLVFYMGVGNLPSICKSLTDHGLDPRTPAALIRWGTTAGQQVLTGSVRTLPQLARDADFKPPAIAVIGRVVSLREKLNWFERRPLFGRRIVVTRARAQASDLASKLEQLGAEVVELPTIRIVPPADTAPLDRAARKAADFDWIVFTSVNAVDAFFAALKRAGADARGLSGSTICAIGPATAKRLAGFGIRADAQPPTFTSAAIIETLASGRGLSGVRILCPRADIAPKELVRGLAAHGAEVTEVTAYRTVPDASSADRAAGLFDRGEIHWITFTSSSTVKNFFDLIAPEALRGQPARLASIGPATTAALAELGCRAAVQADPHTVDGLVEAILGFTDT